MSVFDTILTDFEPRPINKNFDPNLDTLGGIGIIPIKRDYGIVQGKCASGKTTLLTIIAAEWIKNGKSVLYLSDDKLAYITEKFQKVLPVNHHNSRNLKITSFKNVDESINDYLEVFLVEDKYDIVIVDSFMNHVIPFSELCVKYDTFFLTSLMELKSIMTTYPKVDIRENIQKAQKASFIISITKTKPKELAWYIKLFDYLCFWKPKRVISNTTLKILKNRYGKDGVSYDFNLDYGDMKITAVKNKKND